MDTPCALRLSNTQVLDLEQPAVGDQSMRTYWEEPDYGRRPAHVLPRLGAGDADTMLDHLRRDNRRGKLLEDVPRTHQD